MVERHNGVAPPAGLCWPSLAPLTHWNPLPGPLQERQLAGCRAQLAAAQRDHDYVRDQVTTMEVSLARIYNYDVARRKAGAGA